MARKANKEDMKKLDQAIQQKKGKKSGFFARKLGWSREKTNRNLTSLNDAGYLYYEDDEGGLYPFDENDNDE